MIDDDFDDQQLGNALRRMTGPVADADAAFGAFQRRVRVARMRRVCIVVSTAAAIALGAIGVAAFANGRGPGSITPAGTAITLDSTVDSSIDPSTTATPGHKPGRTDDAESATGLLGSTQDSVSGPGDEDPSGAGLGSNHSGDSSKTSGPGSGPGGSTTGPSGPTGSSGESDDGPSHNGTTVNASQVCTSTGGSFTAVHVLDNSVTNIMPAAGFSVTGQEVSSEKVVVVFGDGNHEFHLAAKWNGATFSCAITH